MRGRLTIQSSQAGNTCPFSIHGSTIQEQKNRVIKRCMWFFMHIECVNVLISCSKYNKSTLIARKMSSTAFIHVEYIFCLNSAHWLPSKLPHNNNSTFSISIVNLHQLISFEIHYSDVFLPIWYLSQSYAIWLTYQFHCCHWLIRSFEHNRMKI